MSKRTTAMLVAMTLLFHCAALSAQTFTLHRGTSRPPAEVFHAGLVAQGTNANPIDHASGASCGDPAAAAVDRTAYVALSERVEDAQLHGRFVYVIHPDQDASEETATFDLANAFRYLAPRAQSLGLNLRQRSAVERMSALDAVHGQHVSRRIPREWIYSVAEFEFNAATGEMDLMHVELNPNYREPARIGSRQVFSASMIEAIQSAPPPRQVTYATMPNGTAVPACMVETCSRRSRAALFSGQPALQCASEAMHAPASRFWQAIDVVLE